MDELSEKLSSLLGDPDGMERIREMAQSLLGSQEEKPEPETPAASPADNVISFKQKINEILDKENVPSSEEQSEAQADEAEESENLDIPAFVSLFIGKATSAL